jgi:diadenosine tetraphosphatase ApaH/serine/threonine PP2A family protein phosphatase
MRQAIFSDIHSNLEALEACVQHARALGATHFACLGDCVGYGADPVPTLDLLMSLPHLILIRGNHDEALFSDDGIDVPGIREALDWTCTQLSPAHCNLLETAPYTLTVGDVTYAHASAYEPRRWEYLRQPEQILACLDATDSRVTFIGHVHVPMVFYRTAAGSLRELYPDPGAAIPLSPSCRYVVNVGSVGQPRDGNNAASYALYDSATAEVAIHRVPYDYVSAAEKILDAGLSARFAERLVEAR